MNPYSPIEWTFDNWPDYHTYLTFLKKVYRHEFRKNGFRRISTSTFEKTEIIEKSWMINDKILESKDFDFRQKPNIWIMRAYLDNEVKDEIQPVYYYYIERYYEKMGDGFNCKDLIWTEIIWENDPILDAIQIYINYTVLNKIGLKDKFSISINSVWIEKEKVKYREELVTFYDNKRHLLTPELEELIDTDPMMILNSTDEDLKILNQSAPKMVPKFLKKDSKAHYAKFVEYLELLEVPYTLDNTLVWDNSTLTNSIWEFRSEKGEVISKGGRYNALAKNLWEAKDVPATWFQADTRMIIKLLKENYIEIRSKDDIDLFFVQLWDEAKSAVLPLSIQAREAWINTVVSLWTPSMKEQILKAQRSKAKYIVMVGIMEARNGIFQVRNEYEWTQEEVKKENLIEYMVWKIWKENLDFYTPLRDLVIGEAPEIEEEY